MSVCIFFPGLSFQAQFIVLDLNVAYQSKSTTWFCKLCSITNQVPGRIISWLFISRIVSSWLNCKSCIFIGLHEGTLLVYQAVAKGGACYNHSHNGMQMYNICTVHYTWHWSWLAPVWYSPKGSNLRVPTNGCKWKHPLTVNTVKRANKRSFKKEARRFSVNKKLIISTLFYVFHLF